MSGTVVKCWEPLCVCVCVCVEGGGGVQSGV